MIMKFQNTGDKGRSLVERRNPDNIQSNENQHDTRLLTDNH